MAVVSYYSGKLLHATGSGTGVMAILNIALLLRAIEFLRVENTLIKNALWVVVVASTIVGYVE